MIGRVERIRIATVFLGLGCLGAAVVVRLGDLQLAGPPRDGLRHHADAVQAARGAIVDRHGDPLAFDRPIYEVRVEVEDVPGLPIDRDPVEDDDVDLLRDSRDRLVADMLWALGRDQARFGATEAREDLRRRLTWRVLNAMKRACDAWITRPERARAGAMNFLVDRELDDADAIAALRSLDYREVGLRRGPGAPKYRLYFDMILRHDRVYTDPEHASEVIGKLQDGLYREDGEVVDDRIPVSGLERLSVLLPGEAGEVTVLRDADNRSFWTNRRREPRPGATLHTTLDRALQRCADVELGRAADVVRDKYDGPPEWGGLVLIDVATGGVLAAASYAAEQDGTRSRRGAFGPTQRVFDPGSVVKPLHIAMGIERGLIRWDDQVDCTPGYLAAYGLLPEPLPAARRITDAHPIHGAISVRDVLVRSSNIGAVRLGLSLGPQGIEDYLRRYEFGVPTGVRLPAELSGSRPGAIPKLPVRDQYIWSGPSVLFGYEMQATILQVARAYLTLLSGRRRSLHLVDGIEVDGVIEAVVDDPDTERFLSPATVESVKRALVGVVEEEHGTAKDVGRWVRSLRAAGMVDLEIAGKTGTSQYDGKGKKWNGEPISKPIRTSSFVGFTPVREPRYLVVCVLQKAGAGSFYGGTYAAPAASRLLVEALKRETSELAPGTGRSGPLRVAGITEPGGSGIRVRR